MPPPDPLRVLVVASLPMARAGLQGLVGESDRFTVVGQSASVAHAGRAVLDLEPEVVLAAWDAGAAADLIELIDSLGQTGVPVVLLGEMPPPQELRAVLRAGARGFLLTDATAGELGAALGAASQGLLALDPLLGHALATALPAAPPDEVDEAEPLTEREHEVLQLLALGLPNKAIAQRLHISEHTVKFHIGAIMAKLAAGSRTEAVTRAIRLGILAL